MTKIEWCDETINPLGWGCYGPGGTAEKPNICSYCYAAKIARRNLRGCPDCRSFKPHWHPGQLDKLDLWQKPRRVFVQSMGDLWGEWVPEDFISQTIGTCVVNSRHTYLFLTKNPTRMGGNWNWPRNSWAGVTVTCQADMWRVAELLKVNCRRKFVCFEPLLGPVRIDPLWLYSGLEDNKLVPSGEIHWAIIGAETGQGAKIPKYEWINALCKQLDDAHVPMFTKANLRPAIEDWGPADIWRWWSQEKP